ncbi:acyl-CoA dehydrogenase family protein [Pseudonocardia acaciae]|uniref:acyl-CoA dehydrogenase family protein n=1 Tax=Pseudonocardia acaciae TaxID=551276 RepID=UPI00048FEE62|nr:acyl-CoA dehydrogenase family protein [Pseudonocardia acaciae]
MTGLDGFRAEVRAFLAENVPSVRAAHRDEVAMRRDWDRRLHAAGLAGLSWPAEHGGRGLGARAEFVYHEEAALAGAPEGYGRVGRLLTGPLLIRHGTAGQVERFLPPILSGAEVWCQGFSEPEAGSDLANVRTLAVRDGEEYRVTGQKTWTSFAQHADFCLLLARTCADAPRHRNLGMFLLDMRQPGVQVRPIRQISGASRFCELFLTEAVVPCRNRVGAEGDGWRMALSVLTEERGPADAITRYVSFAALVGLLRECCARAGGPELERLHIRVELIRWHALRALEASADGAEAREIASVFKLMWSHTWQELAGYGVSLSCPEHDDRWRTEYLDSRAGTIFSGTSEVQRNLVAERLLGLPR